MAKPEVPSDWPQPQHELDDFPLAEERGIFAIRLNYADPFGTVINKTLDRLDRPERYVLFFVEDNFLVEGIYTLPEARKVIAQIQTGSCENLVDSNDMQSVDKSIFDAVEFVKPQMNPSELNELDIAMKMYQEAKRQDAYEWN